MAETIKITIDAETMQAIQSIKKFASESTKNLNKVTKSLDEQTDVLKETSKSVDLLSFRYKALVAAASPFVVAIGLQSKSITSLLTKTSSLNTSFLRNNKTVDTFIKSISGSGKVVGSLAKASRVLDKGLIGLGLNLGTLSVALLGVSGIADQLKAM